MTPELERCNQAYENAFQGWMACEDKLKVTLKAQTQPGLGLVFAGFVMGLSFILVLKRYR